MPERSENETRADVARRLDKPEKFGPKAYEVGSKTTRTGPSPTPTGMTPRPEVTGARRVVVKVGSSSLTTAGGGIDPDRSGALVDVLAAAGPRAEVVLVSSGAIAAGLALLRLARRPGLAAQQAAAVGRAGCWCTATPRSWPGTASSPARSC